MARPKVIDRVFKPHIVRRFTGKTCRMSTMFVLTFAFFLLEVIFGYMTNSMALIADSFHMLSDVLALIIAFACMKISKRRYSPKNTFGWVRAEVLGALINTVFLVALSFSIVLESIQRFFEPDPINNAQNVLIVGALGLGVNIIGLFLFHGHGGHGHSHGGGGGHGHSHGGHGHSHDKKANANGHGHSHDGHGHSHDGHGHSHDKPRPTIKPLALPSTASLPSQSSQSQIENHDDCHDEVFENGDTVVEPEVEIPQHVVGAVRRVRRMSSKYYIPGEELAQMEKEAKDFKAGTPEAPPSAEAKPGKKKLSGETQMNMHGIWLHVMGDAFGSIVVIVNAVVNMTVSITFWRNYLDPMLSLLMSMIIMGSSIPLLKESAMILLQTVPTHINVQEIKQKLLTQFGHIIADVHEFHVWRLSGNKIVATAHIRCNGDMDDYMRLAEKLKEFFHDEGIHSTTIQPELVRGSRVNPRQCALKCPKKEGDRQCSDEACCIVPPTPSLEVVTTNPFPFRSSVGSSGGGRIHSSASRVSVSGNQPTIVEEEPVDPTEHDYDHDHEHHDHEQHI